MSARVHVAAYLDEATIQRIDGWAEKFGVSRSKMVSMLAQAGVENDGWLIDVVTSRFGVKVALVLKAAGLLKSEREPESTAVPPEPVKAAG